MSKRWLQQRNRIRRHFQTSLSFPSSVRRWKWLVRWVLGLGRSCQLRGMIMNLMRCQDSRLAEWVQICWKRCSLESLVLHPKVMSRQALTENMVRCHDADHPSENNRTHIEPDQPIRRISIVSGKNNEGEKGWEDCTGFDSFH